MFGFCLWIIVTVVIALCGVSEYLSGMNMYFIGSAVMALCVLLDEMRNSVIRKMSQWGI